MFKLKTISSLIILFLSFCQVGIQLQHKCLLWAIPQLRKLIRSATKQMMLL